MAPLFMAPIWQTPFGQKPCYNIAYMWCLASQGYPSPSFKSNIFPSGWILGSGLVPWEFTAFEVGSGVGSCWAFVDEFWAPASFPWEFTAFEVGSCVGSSWALVGSGDFSMRIYSIWGGLRCALLWVPATFLWEFTAFCVLRKPARVGGLALYKRIFGLKCWSGQCSGRTKWCQFL